MSGLSHISLPNICSGNENRCCQWWNEVKLMKMALNSFNSNLHFLFYNLDDFLHNLQRNCLKCTCSASITSHLNWSVVDDFLTNRAEPMTGVFFVPDGTEIVTYADECTINASDPCFDGICSKLNTHLPGLVAYSYARNKIKSTPTLFITWFAEIRTDLTVQSREIWYWPRTTPKCSSRPLKP